MVIKIIKKLKSSSKISIIYKQYSCMAHYLSLSRYVVLLLIFEFPTIFIMLHYYAPIYSGKIICGEFYLNQILFWKIHVIEKVQFL